MVGGSRGAATPPNPPRGKLFWSFAQVLELSVHQRAVTALHLAPSHRLPLLACGDTLGRVSGAHHHRETQTNQHILSPHGLYTL
eukprot:548080-Prorocentrum_minimum.AAC.1